MAPSKPDLPQGTLDLLILKTLALGPLHGYAVAQQLQQVSRDVVIVQQGRVEAVGYRARREVLPAHTRGTGAAEQRDGQLASAHGGCGVHPAGKGIVAPNMSDTITMARRREGAKAWT